ILRGCRVAVLRIFGYADDFKIRTVALEAQSEVLPDGIGIAKEAVREGFIDDGHMRRLLGIAVVEGASSYHRSSNGLEVVRRHARKDGIYVSDPLIVVAGERDVQIYATELLWGIEREACARAAGDLLEPILNPLIQVG